MPRHVRNRNWWWLCLSLALMWRSKHQLLTSYIFKQQQQQHCGYPRAPSQIEGPAGPTTSQGRLEERNFGIYNKVTERELISCIWSSRPPPPPPLLLMSWIDWKGIGRIVCCVFDFRVRASINHLPFYWEGIICIVRRSGGCLWQLFSLPVIYL